MDILVMVKIKRSWAGNILTLKVWGVDLVYLSVPLYITVKVSYWYSSFIFGDISNGVITIAPPTSMESYTVPALSLIVISPSWISNPSISFNI